MNRIFTIIISCFLASCFNTRLKKKDTITIGNQIWMNNNLSSVIFRNGDTIKEARTDEEWNQARFAENAAWCYVKNNSATDSIFGKLYNWYAVSDPRGLAQLGGISHQMMNGQN